MKDIGFWLALNSIPNIGKTVYKSLISKFNNPKNIFSARLEELLKTEGLKKDAALAIKRFDKWEEIEKEISLIQKHNVSIVTIKESNFPKNLLTINDPPPYLYVKGNVLPQDNLAVAIVGTRTPSHYGVAMAERIAMELAEAGVTVVSGLARGIDSAAHRGAIAGKGRTIAVLGCGIDIVYPQENKKLFGEIAEKGAVVSEFPIGMPPMPQNFPMRNRIISGLSLGVLVVEASLKSGSLITARLALDYGRDVFALPGAITSERSKGTNKLIKDGAKLIECAEDILDELPVKRGARKESIAENRDLLPEEEDILNLLEGSPLLIDTIIQEMKLSAAKANAVLMDMEIKGLVGQGPGKIFYKKN